MFGLSHCQTRSCVMYFSNSLRDTDFKDYTSSVNVGPRDSNFTLRPSILVTTIYFIQCHRTLD